jgi:hypothetical protein
MKASLFLVLFLFLFGCTKDTRHCGYKDPVNEIAWLSYFVNDTLIIGCDVYEAVYKDTTGFYIVIYRDSARTKSKAATTFANCEGKGICSTGGIMPPNCPDYKQYETHRKLIYSR